MFLRLQKIYINILFKIISEICFFYFRTSLPSIANIGILFQKQFATEKAILRARFL